MLSDKQKEDIGKLIEIGRKQGNKLNLSFILISVKHEPDDLIEINEYIENEGIEIINEDVEPEENISYSDIDQQVSPFDPSKIDIKMGTLTIDSIIKRIKNEELEFDSLFQRKAGLWNDKQKSQLIESIFLKIPLPAFYFDATNDDKWQIIDGLQRITTLKEYVVEKKFALSGMEFLHDLNGVKYDNLPRSLQRRLEETELNIYQVNPATPKNVKFNIFKRINTGGLTLEPQEIRNALYQGKATVFLLEMAKTPEFREATGYSIKTDRMLDREFCLRYIAFVESEISSYSGNLDEFLNNTMEMLNKKDDSSLNEIKNHFTKTMKNCKNIFGNLAFRRVNPENFRRGPVNKALFEAWSVTLKNLPDSQIDILISKKQQLLDNYFKLFYDNTFLNSIKAADKTSVNTRINIIKNITYQILGK